MDALGLGAAEKQLPDLTHFEIEWRLVCVGIALNRCSRRSISKEHASPLHYWATTVAFEAYCSFHDRGSPIM
jgi:hypothetical protein